MASFIVVHTIQGFISTRSLLFKYIMNIYNYELLQWSSGITLSLFYLKFQIQILQGYDL